MASDIEWTAEERRWPLRRCADRMRHGPHMWDYTDSWKRRCLGRRKKQTPVVETTTNSSLAKSLASGKRPNPRK